MKKVAVFLLISLIALSGLCAKGEAETVQNKAVTLTFGSHQSGLPNTGIVQDLAKEFEAETGIKIDFQISPDAQWRDLIKVKLDSGEATDIICVDTPIDLMSSIKMAKYCVPLTGEEFYSRMSAESIAAVSDNGVPYGITFPGPKMWFVVYNKKIFADLGLKVPTTYEEFKSVCQTVLDNGITPLFECTTNGWHQVLPLFETGGLWLAQDPEMYDKLNANKIDLDGIPMLKEIIREQKEFADLGYFGKDYLSNTWEDKIEPIGKGKVAMVIAELGIKTEIVTAYPEYTTQDFGQFVMPWADNQIIGVNPASNAFFINKESKHIDEARQFFAFLARHENLQKRQDGQIDIASMCWPEITPRFSEEENAYINSLEKARVVQTSVNYIDSQWMDIGKDLESMFIGATSVDGVLKSIMNRRTAQALLQRDPNWK